MKKISLFTILNATLLSLIALSMVFPLWTVIVTSISSATSENWFNLFPQHFTLSAYSYIFNVPDITDGLIATIKVTLIGVSVNMIVTFAYAYGLSVPRLPGKKMFVTYTVIPLFFSGGLIPLYITAKNYGLVNTIWVMILPVAVNIWYVIVVKSFYTDMSPSIRESAMIDGANEVQILLKIMLPMSKAIIATILLFYAVERWNEWFFSSIFISNGKLFTLQKVLRDILMHDSITSGISTLSYKNATTRFIDSQTIRMATTVVAVLPIALIYPFLQKYFVAGVNSGAVKE